MDGAPDRMAFHLVKIELVFIRKHPSSTPPWDVSLTEPANAICRFLTFSLADRH
jgi:hypothetical protein